MWSIKNYLLQTYEVNLQRPIDLSLKMAFLSSAQTHGPVNGFKMEQLEALLISQSLKTSNQLNSQENPIPFICQQVVHLTSIFKRDQRLKTVHHFFCGQSHCSRSRAQPHT